MKKTYRFHYDTYAIGENEQLYENMAKKGWKLEKRGVHLSKFTRSEPENRRYRIELSSPSFLEEQEMPDDQIALYEDCGWEFVTNNALVHVFTAPENSDAPEFYSDPRQQAGALKALRRSYRSGWVAIVIILAVHALIAAAIAKDPAQLLPGAWASILRVWFQSSALLLTYAAILLSEIYKLIYGAIRTSLLYRRLKAGKPLDHTPKKHIAHHIVTGFFWTMIAVMLICVFAQMIGTEQFEMPLKSDEPYLILGQDLGIDGQRDTMSWQTDGSTVETGSSFAAERIWNTHEHVNDAWLYQDIYLLRSEKQVDALVEMLMYTSTFGEKPENFTQLQIEGLDAAYTCGFDGIAVKDTLVYYITYSGRCDEALFRVLADKIG